MADSFRRMEGWASRIASTIVHPSHWDRHALWEAVFVAPVACLPAVVVGLLLNILDALSYGKCCDEALA
jgi:SulP family sulfate permease